MAARSGSPIRKAWASGLARARVCIADDVAGAPTSLTRRELVCACAQRRSRDAMAACHVPPGYPRRGLVEAEAPPRRSLERPPSRDDIRLPTTCEKLHSRGASAVVAALCDLPMMCAGPAEGAAGGAAWGVGPGAEGAGGP